MLVEFRLVTAYYSGFYLYINTIDWIELVAWSFHYSFFINYKNTYWNMYWKKQIHTKQTHILLFRFYLCAEQLTNVRFCFANRFFFLLFLSSLRFVSLNDFHRVPNSRVSVMRGQVITPQGLGIVGIRVSVDRDSRFGFTLTRQGGW